MGVSLAATDQHLPSVPASSSGRPPDRFSGPPGGTFQGPLPSSDVVTPEHTQTGEIQKTFMQVKSEKNKKQKTVISSQKSKAGRREEAKAW